MGEIQRDGGGMGRESDAGAAEWRRLRAASPAQTSGSVLLAMLLVAACVFLLYAGTLASMIRVWANSSTFVHGFLVLPVSAILIWRRRAALSAAAAKPSPAGFALLAVSVFAWLLSSEAYAQVGQHLALIALVVSGIWAVVGTRNARAIRFPLLFAFFAVPFGEFLIPPLMSWTAGFTVWALNATGIPVYLEAYVFALPSGTFEVVEACSGIRYLLVAVVFAVFFAYERFRSYTRRILFVLCAAAGMIVANGIRAYLLVLIAHLSEMRFGTGLDHLYFGWFVFLVSIIVIFWIGGRFADAVPAGAPAADRRDLGRPAEGAGRSPAWLALAGAMVVIALGPLGQRVAGSAPAQTTSVALPQAVGGWSGPGPAEYEYRPSFTGDFEARHGGYASAAGRVDVHAVFFAEQSQGSELVGLGSRVFDWPWRLLRRPETKRVSLESGPMEVTSLVVGDGRQELVLWYWYDVGGRLTTSDIATKLYHAFQGILGRNRGDAALILATRASTSNDGRDAARLEQFLDSHIEALGACLRAVPGESANCTDPL